MSAGKQGKFEHHFSWKLVVLDIGPGPLDKLMPLVLNGTKHFLHIDTKRVELALDGDFAGSWCGICP